MENEKFIEILTAKLNRARSERDKLDSGSPMWLYYDGKVVAFESALDSYKLWVC